MYAITEVEDGLEFEVPENKPSLPALRFELAVERWGTGWEFLIGLRIVAGGLTLAWIEMEDYWGRHWVATTDHAMSVVSHIRASDVEMTKDWPRWFLNRLAESEHSPFFRGVWRLTVNPQPKPPDYWTYPFHEEHDCHVAIPLRTASRGDSGRVKWWRKIARDGKLPPILTYRCELIPGEVIIDGHDRLLAARLESVRPVFLSLSSIRTEEIDGANDHLILKALQNQLERKPEQQTVDGVNRALIRLYDKRWIRKVSRAFPVDGGIDSLRTELQNAFRDVDPSIRKQIEEMF